MAYYSALVAPLSPGSALLNQGNTVIGSNPAAFFGTNGYSVARISPITQPHYVIEDPGGFIAADFVIPSEVAGLRLGQLQVDAFCWLVDGSTPIFYGKIASQPTHATNGDMLVSVNGHWVDLHQTRMREIWDDQDMAKWLPNEGNDHSPQLDLTSNGRIRIQWNAGTVLANGNRAQLDYFLFNEPVGTRDTKKIVGFDINCVDDIALGDAKIAFRVYGRPDANIGAGAEDQLTGITGPAGSFSVKEGAVADSWASSSGYRCIRMGMQAISAGTMGADRFLTFDRLRIATRETLFTVFGSPPSSSDIAADVFRRHTSSVNWLDTPPTYWRDSASLTAFGGDPVQRGVAPSGVDIDSMVFTTWTSPADVLSALTTIDGFKAGFYFPSSLLGWWDSTDVPWPLMMPELSYTAWSSLSSPDYRVSIRKGAQPEMDDSPQPLITDLYVSYEHANGRAFSVYVQDDSTVNYLYAQGVRRSEDYNIESPVGDAVALALADQVFTLRRQPVAAGKVHLWANRPGSVVDANGANLARLSDLRPGVVEVTDLPGTSFKTGRATRIEWWGETLDEPEHVELELTHPGKVNLPRRLGAVGVLAQRTVRAPKGGARR